MNSRIDPAFMPAKTRAIFNTLCRQSFISNYNLVGGTALAIQLGHRMSEDLDFIYDGEQLNTTTIRQNIGKFFPDYEIIRQDNNLQLDLVINTTKLTFFSSDSVVIPFRVSEHTFRYNKMAVCSAKVIASLKMAAIAQRNTIRDYYDLYWLAKHHIPLLDIIRQTKQLIPHLSPITYTGTLVYTDDIEEPDISDHLQPQEQIDKKSIALFFIEELKKIADQI
jgi:predicted nucleotidyltransferase component of viral defense system